MCVVTVRRLNRYKVIEIQWLSGIVNFVSERDEFILYVNIHLQSGRLLAILTASFGERLLDLGPVE